MAKRFALVSLIGSLVSLWVLFFGTQFRRNRENVIERELVSLIGHRAGSSHPQRASQLAVGTDIEFEVAASRNANASSSAGG